jgi:hypothetical protein
LYAHRDPVKPQIDSAAGASRPDYTNIVAELISPARLATLGARVANPRVQKYVYWLATAQTNGIKPKTLAEAAVEAAGYTNKLARKLTMDAMLRNLDIATQLGCLDKDGLDEMRHGRAPSSPSTINAQPSTRSAPSSRAHECPHSTT